MRPQYPGCNHASKAALACFRTSCILAIACRDPDFLPSAFQGSQSVIVIGRSIAVQQVEDNRQHRTALSWFSPSDLQQLGLTPETKQAPNVEGATWYKACLQAVSLLRSRNRFAQPSLQLRQCRAALAWVVCCCAESEILHRAAANPPIRTCPSCCLSFAHRDCCVFAAGTDAVWFSRKVQPHSSCACSRGRATAGPLQADRAVPCLACRAQPHTLCRTL